MNVSNELPGIHKFVRSAQVGCTPTCGSYCSIMKFTKICSKCVALQPVHRLIYCIQEFINVCLYDERLQAWHLWSRYYSMQWNAWGGSCPSVHNLQLFVPTAFIVCTQSFIEGYMVGSVFVVWIPTYAPSCTVAAITITVSVVRMLVWSTPPSMVSLKSLAYKKIVPSAFLVCTVTSKLVSQNNGMHSIDAPASIFVCLQASCCRLVVSFEKFVPSALIVCILTCAPSNIATAGITNQWHA